jgi:hypothetical protein
MVSDCMPLAAAPIESESKVQVIDESAFEKNSLTVMDAPAPVDMLFRRCLSNYKSLPSATLKSSSKWQRNDDSASTENGLAAIHIPAPVEVPLKYYFSYNDSLPSFPFAREPKLRDVAAETFAWSPHQCTIEYPLSLSEWSPTFSSSIIDVNDGVDRIKKHPISTLTDSRVHNAPDDSFGYRSSPPH